MILYLLHRSEHLIAAPFRESPVIVVLLDTADANSAIGATAPAQKSSSGKAAYLPVEAWLGRRDDVPVERSVVALGPTITMVASVED